MVRIKYQLYKETIPEYSALQQILYNRGVLPQDQESWLNAGWSDINDWRLLDEDKMMLGAKMVVDAIKNKQNVCVLIDPDADGFTSGAIFINYLYSVRPEFVDGHIFYVMHKGKQHGLADTIEEIYSTNPSLVVLPDSSSNDKEQLCSLKEDGVKVLVLDHHLADEDYTDYENIIVVNNQLCGYPNKALTGAGVVWQFCRAFDELCGYDCAKSFTDLVALGMIGDVSNYKELETRAIVNIGLSNINNPFFKEMVEKNKFSINKMNGINYYSTAFYVVPFINACVRSGTQEEKEMVFDSMLLQYSHEQVLSSKRGEKGLHTPLYKEAVTVAEKVKRRQTKLQDGVMALVDYKIENEHLADHAIIACVLEPSECERNIAGLVANLIQDKYQHPSLVLVRTKEADDDEEVYRGSARNYSMCENQDMREMCLASGEMLLAQGHSNAFGSAIAASHFSSFLRKTDALYSNIDFTPSYFVDYIWNQNTIDAEKVLSIGRFNIYGQEIPESKIALEGVPLSADNVTLMGLAKGHPTLKIQVGDVSIMRFKSSEEEYEEFIKPNTYLTLVGKCSVNEWMGKVSPQIIIDDFELSQEWRF